MVRVDFCRSHFALCYLMNNNSNIPAFGDRRSRSGFTLVELMVSTALIAVLMGLLLGTVDQTQRVWQRTTAKVGQFQASRAAFESMTRRLSQATLNTYWRAYDTDITNNIAEYQLRRSSELQFISGSASRIFTSPNLASLNPSPTYAYPTHAVFFQAPTGYTETPASYLGLNSLLSTAGYFLEFGDDPQRPQSIPNANSRFRMRLMELNAPSESVTIFTRKPEINSADAQAYSTLHSIEPQVLDEAQKDYAGLVDKDGKSIRNFVRPFWMKAALERVAPSGAGGVPRFRYAHPLAENIVALVILPKLAVKDRKVGDTSAPDRLDSLAPNFEYDSWRVMKSDVKKGLANAARDNVLPPIVQVVMVAIDEPSAVRANFTANNPPKWTDGLFQTVTTESDLSAQIGSLEKALVGDDTKLTNRVNYRIFSTDVVIRGSKWSTKIND